MKKKKKLRLKKNIFTLFSILASIFLIYNILLLGPIEPFIRYTIIAIIILIDFTLIKNNQKKVKNNSIYFTLSLVFILFNLIIGFGLNFVYSLIDNVNKDKITYSTSLVTKNNEKIKDIDDIVNKKIGLLNDVTSIDNYILANEIIEKEKLKEDNEIIKYENITDLLHDLYQNKIDAIFISSQSMTNIIEEYGYSIKDIKIISTSEKNIKKEESGTDYIKSDGKNINKPFTLLLMGVDSEVDGMIKNAANGDSLILISFNPRTLNTTMLSIPRDSYVPIACFKNNRKNKLTHAGWYGANCMIETIENFLDVDIDYYVKINFKGVVSLVNNLGGVTVEVPKRLCTDNSDRAYEVCIDKGLQKLNGEEALVLARNRYDLARGDLDRGNNQQLLLKALLNEAKNVQNVNKIVDLLTTVSKNIDTNMTTNQILSLYNILKDIIKAGRNNESSLLPIHKLELVGKGEMIYDEKSKLTLWNYVLNENSVKSISKAMQDNLSNLNLIKTFEYSIKEKYTQKSIGT